MSIYPYRAKKQVIWNQSFFDQIDRYSNDIQKGCLLALDDFCNGRHLRKRKPTKLTGLPPNQEIWELRVNMRLRILFTRKSSQNGLEDINPIACLDHKEVINYIKNLK